MTRSSWRPTTVPGIPPKQCVACTPSDRRSSWRPTDHAPRAPRCATHQRQVYRESRSATQARYQTKTYALSPEEHDALMKYQGGKCAACLIATGSSKALATDHDHSCCSGSTSCGRCVRAKLCSTDNQLIGHVEYVARRNGERPTDVLMRIIGILEDPPMQRVRRQLELA